MLPSEIEFALDLLARWAAGECPTMTFDGPWRLERRKGEETWVCMRCGEPMPKKGSACALAPPAELAHSAGLRVAIERAGPSSAPTWTARLEGSAFGVAVAAASDRPQAALRVALQVHAEATRPKPGRSDAGGESGS